MNEPTVDSRPPPPYEERFSAPVVYFDLIAANGMMNGAIEIELAHRVLTPGTGADVKISFTTSGRLRCSPAAACALIEAIQNALKMIEQPQQTPSAASKLN